ncbi:MAG: hypothetical protein LBQ88_00925 [Treponema sp.]|jgi:hypothetical protein|nr:hypothetical protein [Treponema sp.]
MKLVALIRKGSLLIPAAAIMLFWASCGFFSIKIQDALDKGSDMVLAGRIRSGKQVVINDNKTAAAEERAPAQNIQSTPGPVNSSTAGRSLSSGQARLPSSGIAVTGTAVLYSGNAWGKGLPGFGENVFPCFFGEYQLKLKSIPIDDKTEKIFSVWASKEPLLFPEENWQMLPPIQAGRETALFPNDGEGSPAAEEYTVMRRLNDQHYLLALVLNENTYGEAWRVLFQFPQDNEGLILSTAQINRLIGEWVKWFLYFRASAQNAGELSFPAVLNF